MGELAAGATIWAIGAVVVYWNLEGRGIFPSNDHVRVIALIWPIAAMAGVVPGGT